MSKINLFLPPYSRDTKTEMGLSEVRTEESIRINMGSQATAFPANLVAISTCSNHDVKMPQAATKAV